MLIQINSDRHVDASESLIAQVRAMIEGSLSYVADRITRVEAHLSDEDGERRAGEKEKRCLLEARVAGRQPVAVSHQAATVESAVAGAAEKLARLLDSTFGRLADQDRIAAE